MLGCAHAVARYNRVATTTNQQAFDTMSPSVSVLFLRRIENFSFSAFNLFTDEIRMLPLVSRSHDYLFLKERAMCSRLFPKVSVSVYSRCCRAETTDMASGQGSPSQAARIWHHICNLLSFRLFL